jgi:hypothetical protein
MFKGQDVQEESLFLGSLDLNMFKKKAFFLCILTLDDGINTLSQNVGIEAMQRPRRLKISPTVWQKPGILHDKVASWKFV